MNIRFYNGKILVTPEPNSFLIQEGELWVCGDRIVYVGDGSDTEQVFTDRKEKWIIWDREIDMKGNLLMPGFKDAHTHTAMTFLRSHADDMPLQQWLNQQVFPYEAKLTEEDAYYLDILGIMEYLTSGITANFDMYPFSMAHARASADCGFRTAMVSGFNDFVSSIEEMEEHYHVINEYSPLTSYFLGFHAEYTISRERLGQVAALAEKLHAPVYMHNSETQAEVTGCRERYGVSPTQLMERMGIFQYGGGGYHCIYLDEEDIDIFKRRGLYAVTNPASNLKLASGIAPLNRFLQEGIPVAIGTDGPASNNCLDMFREMFLVTGLAKIREQDAACMQAEQVLYMATAGGAHAMGLSDCDCLAVGKKADLILIDLYQPNMQPENHLVKNLVYSGSKQNVKLTMVDGRILYEDQKFSIGFDPEEIYQKTNTIARRIFG
ncbi:MAG: amidohydrolase family protein [Roseburia sp.]